MSKGLWKHYPTHNNTKQNNRTYIHFTTEYKTHFFLYFFKTVGFIPAL